MKSRLALLAAPFIALACSDAEQATLLDPPAVSADVTIETAPEPSPLVITCEYAAGGACIQINENFYDTGANNNSLVLYWTVNPATKGTVTVHICKEGELFRTADYCADHNGGHWVKSGRYRVAEVGSGPYGFYSVATIYNLGFRVKYTGQGSGYQNDTQIFNAYAQVIG